MKQGNDFGYQERQKNSSGFAISDGAPEKMDVASHIEEKES
jgi:hypothetical protein